MVLNVCLIGAGRAGNFHVKSINRTPNIKISYIVDSDIDKAIALSKLVDNGDYNNPCPHDNIELVLQENITSKDNVIDIVIVASSTQTHYKMTMLALTYGKHVLCEKPLGNQIQIKDCFELADKNNLKLLIGFQKRFDVHYSDFIRTISSDPKHYPVNEIIMTTRDFPLPSMEYLKTSNGIVEDMMSHDIDIVNCIMEFQKPESIFAFSHTNNPELLKMNEIEHITIMMYYSIGTIVTLHGSRTASHCYDQRAEAYTSKELIRMDNVKENTITEVINQITVQSEIKHSFPERYQQAYKSELEYFIEMVKHNADSLIKCEHMLLNAQICSAINKSLEIKEKMQL